MHWLKSIRYRWMQPVTIVSGLPRSGTSMTVKMLEAGGLPVYTDRARRPDIDNPGGYYEFERVKRLAEESDKRWVAECRGKVLKVISFLLPDLPSELAYRVVFMSRDLDEVVASQNKMLQRRGELLQEDGVVRRMFEDHLLRIRRWIAQQPNFRLLEVPYADVVRSPQTQAHRIRDFLGDPRLDVLKMAEVVNPELYRNRSGGI
ncbi:MAG: hypothetical protein Kow001_10100 [Acidobacteriota bacterium]